MQKLEKPEAFLYPPNCKFYWDWFAENPIELILMAFILIIFFFLPKEGCGLSNKSANNKENQAVTRISKIQQDATQARIH